MRFKTGCNPRKPGAAGPLLFSKYLDTLDLPPAPEKVYREYKIADGDWQMFGNNTVGDCTCAAIAHMIMLFTAHTGRLFVPDPQAVLDFYSAASGYNQATGANDNGADLPTVLDMWRDVGLQDHKILQWGDLPTGDQMAQKHGIHIFGAVDDAVMLTDTDQEAFQAGLPWDGPGAGNEGHSVPRFGYGSDGCDCVSWAQNQKQSWDWIGRRLTECTAVITQDWLDNADGLTPSGFPLDALVTDLKNI